MRTTWPVVLAYHRVTDAHDQALCVSPGAFRVQMETLLRWGLKPAALADRGPGRFVVTFDDGYGDNHQHAFPVLERLGIPAIFYVNPGLIDPEADPADADRLMTWNELSELRDAGHVVGSHGMTHRDLPGLPEAELAIEVEGSRRAIERVLGTTDDFCYPRGKTEPGVVAAVTAAGYRRAVVTPQSRRPPFGDLAIERVGIYRHDTPWRFRAKVIGLYRALRPLARAIRSPRLRSSSAPVSPEGRALDEPPGHRG